MRRSIVSAAAVVAATVVATCVVIAGSAEAATTPSAAALAISREVLAVGDGWASSSTGTSGRSAADDGLLDITKASDLVTVSYNNFFDHDKTMLIGSTNTVGADVGKLRVTLHHNRFANVGQRAPRVRFGQVDVYNNYFYATDEDSYVYSWGVGVYCATTVSSMKTASGQSSAGGTGTGCQPASASAAT